MPNLHLKVSPDHCVECDKRSDPRNSLGAVRSHRLVCVSGAWKAMRHTKPVTY
jgi:hypothetical protein